mgnify:FL=1
MESKKKNINKKKIFLKIPNFIVPDLRTDHAGETGAVFIYKGILLVSKDNEIINFSKNHLETELKHLQVLDQILEDSQKSKLLFLWRALGFLTGLIPSLFGKNAVYATIYYVESFVEAHYEEQIKLLNKKDNLQLRNLLDNLKNDEIVHKIDSLKKFNKSKIIHYFWGQIITIGSKIAVNISKVI